MSLNNDTLKGAHIQYPDTFWKDLGLLVLKLVIGVSVGAFIGTGIEVL